MKTSALALIASVFLLAVSSPAQKAQTYVGAIMDSQCASLGGHGNMANPGEKDKDCTERCVEMGGAYALFNAGTKTAYQLDDQKKAADFAGVNVKVTGTLDSATNTIKVTDITGKLTIRKLSSLLGQCGIKLPDEPSRLVRF